MIFDLIIRHIPLVFRDKARFVSLISAMLSPLEVVLAQYNEYRSTTLTTLSYNGQVAYMEKMLNDKFDAQQRRIYIDDAVVSAIEPAILYRKNENQDTEILYRKNEAIGFAIYRASEIPHEDFTVFLPDELAIKLSAIKSVIDFYKIASKIYKIQTF